MSLLRQPLLLLARSEQVKKLVTTMPVSSAVVASYVPGESTEEAVDATARLIADGLTVTLDHLGKTPPALARATPRGPSYPDLHTRRPAAAWPPRPRTPSRRRTCATPCRV